MVRPEDWDWEGGEVVKDARCIVGCGVKDWWVLSKSHWGDREDAVLAEVATAVPPVYAGLSITAGRLCFGECDQSVMLTN